MEATLIGYVGTVVNLAVPDTVEDGGFVLRVAEIGAQAFYNCKTVRSADLGSVDAIDSQAFFSCSVLKNVKFQGTLVYSKAFGYCHRLHVVDLGDDIERIGNQAFAKCEGLTDVSFGGSLELVNAKAFSGTVFTDAQGVEIAKDAASLAGHRFVGSDGVLAMSS